MAARGQAGARARAARLRQLPFLSGARVRLRAANGRRETAGGRGAGRTAGHERRAGQRRAVLVRGARADPRGGPATEAEWIAAAQGKSMREMEDMVSGRRPGDRPGDPADLGAKRHVLRLEISGDTLAAFREARRRLELDVGHSLDDDEAIRMLAHYALGGPSDTGRAAYQVAMTLCQQCGRGTRDGAGRELDVEQAEIEAACCDAQHIGNTHVGGEPGKATQTIPPRIRRLVYRRAHGRCEVPGCRAARFLEIHHIVPRAAGGTHDPSLLVLLCSAHHLQVHRRALRVSGTAPDHLKFRRLREVRPASASASPAPPAVSGPTPACASPSTPPGTTSGPATECASPPPRATGPATECASPPPCATGPATECASPPPCATSVSATECASPPPCATVPATECASPPPCATVPATECASRRHARRRCRRQNARARGHVRHRGRRACASPPPPATPAAASDLHADALDGLRRLGFSAAEARRALAAASGGDIETLLREALSHLRPRVHVSCASERTPRYGSRLRCAVPSSRTSDREYAPGWSSALSAAGRNVADRSRSASGAIA